MDWDRPRAREKVGIALGKSVAPLVGFLSATRHARMFHPDGLVFAARVEPVASAPDLALAAERLAGSALVRFSSALWRREREWPDVLGVAVRFRWLEPALAVQQDLLLATIRSPWTMPLAPLATNFRSFLWNHYHAVSPFDALGVGRVKLRLRSPRLRNATGGSRAHHLERAAAEGQATFELQFRRLERPLLQRRWEAAARLTLEGALDTDQAALRFSPFRAGAGLRPVGFVHSLRLGAYAASQAARPAQEPSYASPGD